MEQNDRFMRLILEECERLERSGEIEEGSVSDMFRDVKAKLANRSGRKQSKASRRTKEREDRKAKRAREREQDRKAGLSSESQYRFDRMKGRTEKKLKSLMMDVSELKSWMDENLGSIDEDLTNIESALASALESLGGVTTETAPGKGPQDDKDFVSKLTGTDDEVEKFNAFKGNDEDQTSKRAEEIPAQVKPKMPSWSSDWKNSANKNAPGGRPKARTRPAAPKREPEAAPEPEPEPEAAPEPGPVEFPGSYTPTQPDDRGVTGTSEPEFPQTDPEELLKRMRGRDRVNWDDRAGKDAKPAPGDAGKDLRSKSKPSEPEAISEPAPEPESEPEPKTLSNWTETAFKSAKEILPDLRDERGLGRMTTRRKGKDFRGGIKITQRGDSVLVYSTIDFLDDDGRVDFSDGSKEIYSKDEEEKYLHHLETWDAETTDEEAYLARDKEKSSPKSDLLDKIKSGDRDPYGDIEKFAMKEMERDLMEEFGGDFGGDMGGGSPDVPGGSFARTDRKKGMPDRRGVRPSGFARDTGAKGSHVRLKESPKKKILEGSQGVTLISGNEDAVDDAVEAHGIDADPWELLDQADMLFSKSGIRVARDEGLFQLAILDNEVVGATVASEKAGEEGLVVRFSVAVSEAARRKGIARTLVSSLVNAQGSGTKIEAWVVNPDAMVPLLSSLGFDGYNGPNDPFMELWV